MKKNNIYGRISILKKILKTYYLRDKLLFVYMFIKSLFDLMTPLISTFVLSYIVGNVTNNRNPRDYLGNVAILSVVLMITNYFSSTLKEKIDSSITIYRQNLFLIPLFHKVFEMPFNKYDDSKIQQEINSAVDASFSEWSGIEGIMKELTNFITLFASFFIYLILMFRFSWEFVALCLFFSSINVLLSQYSIKEEDKLVEKVFGINRQLEYLFQKSIDPKAGKDIRIYQINDTFKTLFKNGRTDRNKLLQSIEKKYIPLDILQLIFSAFQKLLGVLFISYKCLYDNLDIGYAVFYLTMIEQFSMSFTHLYHSIISLIKNSKLVQPYFDFMERTVLLNQNTLSISHFSNLSLENVYYHYPDQKRDVIKNLSLRIKAGEKIAIVGGNGEGKTTLIKLILGLLHPTNGKVLLNDKIDLSGYPNGIGIPLVSGMFQQSNIFPFTIEENITTNFSSKTEKERLFEVLKNIDLFDYINQLPNKEKTYITKLIDASGIELSGGLTQKMYLGRVLYSNPQIIILDEPTSMFDAESERKFYEQFHIIFKDKTLIYISHRLASTSFCDRIIVLEDGNIVEEGMHEELIKNKKSYYRMYNSQQKSYQT